MGFPSKHEFIAEAIPRLQPYQIVCLEHEASYLYAEVIQIIETRGLCWARPLVLVLRSSEFTCDNSSLEQSKYYDLRQDSDLLLPLTLFRVALDTEVLSWITSLYADDCHTIAPGEPQESGYHLFRQLVQSVWQAHPAAFQNSTDSGKT
jgi:hypothetical protein